MNASDAKEQKFQAFDDMMFKTMDDIDPDSLRLEDMSDLDIFVLNFQAKLPFYGGNRGYLAPLITQLELEKTPENKLHRLIVMENLLKRSIDTKDLGIDMSKDYTLLSKDQDKNMIHDILLRILPEKPDDASDLDLILTRFLNGDIDLHGLKEIVDKTSTQIKKFLTEDCVKFTQSINEELQEIESTFDSSNEYFKYTFGNLRRWLQDFQIHCKMMGNLDKNLNYIDGGDETYEPLQSIQNNLLKQNAVLQSVGQEADGIVNINDSLVQINAELTPERRKKVLDDFNKNDNVPSAIRSSVKRNKASLSRDDLIAIQMVNSIQKSSLNILVDFANEAEKFDNLDDMAKHFKREFASMTSQNPAFVKLQKTVEKLLNRVSLNSALVGKGSGGKLGNQFMKIVIEVIRNKVTRENGGWFFSGSAPKLSTPISNVVDSILFECVNRGILDNDVEKFDSGLTQCLQQQGEIYKDFEKKHAKEHTIEWGTLALAVGFGCILCALGT